MALIESITFGEQATRKNQLTATLALVNAFIPNFRGTAHTKVEHQHKNKVITRILGPN